MKYKIYVKSKRHGWLHVKKYKGHDLMVTQDGKIVFYDGDMRIVFGSDIPMKVVTYTDDWKSVDEEMEKIIINNFLRNM